MTETRESVKARFEAEGVSIADWSRRHGFDDRAVHAVLAGKTKWTRGTSHRIAGALGIKKEPDTLRLRDDVAA